MISGFRTNKVVAMHIAYDDAHSQFSWVSILLSRNPPPWPWSAPSTCSAVFPVSCGFTVRPEAPRSMDRLWALRPLGYRRSRIPHKRGPAGGRAKPPCRVLGDPAVADLEVEALRRPDHGGGDEGAGHPAHRSGRRQCGVCRNRQAGAKPADSIMSAGGRRLRAERQTALLVHVTPET